MSRATLGWWAVAKCPHVTDKSDTLHRGGAHVPGRHAADRELDAQPIALTTGIASHAIGRADTLDPVATHLEIRAYRGGWGSTRARSGGFSCRCTPGWCSPGGRRFWIGRWG